MSETATLSTVIDAKVKKAVTEFCKRRGIKMSYLIEQALVEQLEGEIDLEAYWQRRDEETVPLSVIGKKSTDGYRTPIERAFRDYFLKGKFCSMALIHPVSLFIFSVQSSCHFLTALFCHRFGFAFHLKPVGTWSV